MNESPILPKTFVFGIPEGECFLFHIFHIITSLLQPILIYQKNQRGYGGCAEVEFARIDLIYGVFGGVVYIKIALLSYKIKNCRNFATALKKWLAFA